jgi:hypothetical protein
VVFIKRIANSEHPFRLELHVAIRVLPKSKKSKLCNIQIKRVQVRSLDIPAYPNLSVTVMQCKRYCAGKITHASALAWLELEKGRGTRAGESETRPEQESCQEGEGVVEELLGTCVSGGYDGLQ